MKPCVSPRFQIIQSRFSPVSLQGVSRQQKLTGYSRQEACLCPVLIRFQACGRGQKNGDFCCLVYQNRLNGVVVATLCSMVLSAPRQLTVIRQCLRDRRFFPAPQLHSCYKRGTDCAV